VSDFPFKKGDLVTIRSNAWAGPDSLCVQEGIIVEERQQGFFDILVNGHIRTVHRTRLITPKIKSVKMTGGLK